MVFQTVGLKILNSENLSVICNKITAIFDHVFDLRNLKGLNYPG